MNDRTDERDDLGPDEHAPAREEYSAPTLTSLGDLATLTQLTAGAGADGVPGFGSQ